MKRNLLAILSLLIFESAHSQADTALQVLELKSYIELVMRNHPVVKQSDLVIKSAEANLLGARGGFDPKLTSSFDLKNFKDKEYYDLFNTTLKFQTFLPLDAKVAFDRNEGVYLNPESTIPDSNNNRQLSAGLSMPLGKGLFIDEQRLALKQAKIYQNIAEAEQVKMVNKILLTALKDYWNWYTAYRKMELLEQSMVIARELFKRVKIDYEYGELAAVDTVQAMITFQTRQAEYQKTLFEFENSRLMLSKHLWSGEERPLELRVNTIPQVDAEFGILPSEQGMQEIINWAAENHPEIKKLTNKIDQYAVENKWYRESFKPQVDLSYSFIDAPVNGLGETTAPSFSDNYKFGLDFSFPILLRKERAKLQKNKLKIQSTGYDLEQIKLAVQNNILSKYAETKMSGTLASQYESIASNYDRLLQAEFVNLESGESDLFKLNLQQDKLISSQLKYIENLVKYQKNKAEIYYEAGVPYLSID
ncbi:MAG: TolC family protein [Cyclobacteriaceae bacterium]